MHIRSMNVCVDQSFALVCLWCCICTSQVLETVEQINSIKLQREFYLGFSQNPQKFINDWLASQSRDLKVRGWCASWTDVRPSVLINLCMNVLQPVPTHSSMVYILLKSLLFGRFLHAKKFTINTSFATFRPHGLHQAYNSTSIVKGDE